MFAIVEISGSQFRAEKGAKLRTQKLPEQAGEVVELSRVFLLADGENIQVGTPFVPGARVVARVASHGRGKKIRVVKKAPKKRTASVQGHRQDFTELEITEVRAK